MSKYNYFDDNEEDTKIDELKKAIENFSQTKRQKKYSKVPVQKATVARLANDDSNADTDVDVNDEVEEEKPLFDREKILEELGNISDFRKKALKLLALLLFIVAVICCTLLFIHSINKENKEIEKFNASAGEICAQYIGNYGTGSFEEMSDSYGDDVYRLTGFCFAREMDFNNDGKSELLICYNSNGVYYIEVWGFDKDGNFSTLYRKEANTSNDITDGAWIVLYHSSSKYYIGVNTADNTEDVDLYQLKKYKFEKDSTCQYDLKNEIFYVDGEIDAYSFEKIKLSCISSNLAEQTIETAQNNIDAFNVSGSVSTETSQTDLMNQAYYAIIQQYNQELGSANAVTKNGITYLDGLGIVKLVDFDNDGVDELFIAYRKKTTTTEFDYDGNATDVAENKYFCEVYTFNGEKAVRVFQNEGLSGMSNDSDTTLFILQYNGKKVNYCTNTYSLSNYGNEIIATSKIYEFDGNEFNPTYKSVYESEYGYVRYYVNNERLYNSYEFDQQGYKVPLFRNEDSYDTAEFSVTYLKGKEKYKSDIELQVSTTQSTIKSIYPSYNPDEL